MLVRFPAPNLNTVPHLSHMALSEQPTVVPVKVFTRVALAPGFIRGSDHYLISSSFNSLRLYSVNCNIELTESTIAEEALVIIRRLNKMAKVVAVASEFTLSENADENIITISLADHPIALVTVDQVNCTYDLKIQGNFDTPTRGILESLLRKQLEESKMVTQERDLIDQMKKFIVEQELRLDQKLNFDMLEDVLESAYDELFEEESKCLKKL